MKSWSQALLAISVVSLSDAFLSLNVCRGGTKVHHHYHERRRHRTPSLLRLYSDEESDSIDAMRRLLESSWDTNTMGQVPTSPVAAADEAVTSLNNAIADETASNGSKSRIFFIDILLPQYDIRQGSKMYDEVLATEFCIQLAKRTNGHTEILLRDEQTLATVQRVLAAREKKQKMASDEEESDDEDDESDDEGDVVGNVYEPKPPPTSDVESFRQQLMSGWEKGKSELDSDRKDAEEATLLNVKEPADEPRESNVPQTSFRLASMLGSAKISTGADRSRDVLQAVAQNAKPLESEDTIIILSARSPEEMIAVRSLVAHYGATKTFILINCHLQPTPRELLSAQTLYSVQPLVAVPMQGGDDDAFSPKIVVMRRYPADWEIFIDSDGQGFELAGSFAASRVEKKGPSIKDIADCVKNYLASRRTKQ
ncbi:hypothetical protein MPSEU_000863100 [Mayamaea pseudoterrestris]|nr:hypothetical protein MPSEU_000863100 [Mayamaea pseudoterrestris]